MKVTKGKLPGVKHIQPDVYGDERGFFMETFNRRRYAEIGIDVEMQQANVSKSVYGVLRGLHYQWPNPQGKLVYVLSGTVFDVAVDIRPGSPTFGHWEHAVLSADKHNQFYVPPGFAHGFCVTSESALFAYACTTLYDAQADAGIAWDDPQIGIQWPVDQPQLSPKDLKAPRLGDVAPSRLPGRVE